MTTIVAEIYDALKKLGLDDEAARKAAQAVLGAEEKEQLVTKDFLRAEMNGLEARIQAMLNRHLLAILAAVGTIAALVKLL